MCLPCSFGCSAYPENRTGKQRRPTRRISLRDILLPGTTSCLWQETGALDLREFDVVNTESINADVLKSKCGRPLYDDFQEIQPGAIAKLQQDLYERYEDTNKRSNSGNPESPSNPQNGKSRNSKRSFGQWWSCWRSSGGRPPELPLHQGQNILSQDPDIALPTHSSEVVFLLLCIPHRKWATKLVHMDLCTLLSDQLFFAELQTQYRSMQGKWRRCFTLKQLTRIQFVQFELHKNELVGIQMTNVLPPKNREDYRYSPTPPEIIPPVGENLLMHLYEHPEDADDDTFCLDRIPKKWRERLLRPWRGGGIGSGVHLKKGLNLKKTCIFGLLSLFFSALFRVIWSVKRDDIQGEFGVAAFLMAALTFTTGIVQATLEPE